MTNDCEELSVLLTAHTTETVCPDRQQSKCSDKSRSLPALRLLALNLPRRSSAVPPAFAPSLVAPRKTFVDLNVLDERARDSSDQANGSAGHTHPRSPPSRSDLGGCLWGPTQGSATGRKPPAEAHSHVAGSDSSKPEQSAKAQMSALRQVSFAYVAQPGGKLWRVGLLDGEVASTHCPPVKIDGDSDGRGDVSGGVELGQLRAVDVGGSQVGKGLLLEADGGMCCACRLWEATVLK